MSLSCRMRAVRAAVEQFADVRALAARVYASDQPEWRRRRLAFEWSALRHPHAHRAMAEFFAREPWRAVGATHPQLLQKIHKPFARHGAAIDDRVALVRRHYELMLERLGPALLGAVADDRALPLCGVELPNGQGLLPVTIGKQARFEREGELTLSLIDPFGSLLYSTCFTLREVDGRVGLLVGSLNGTAPREVLRHITKLSCGLRPQSLLVFMLQQVAALAGAERIDAVGRATHAYRGNPRHDEIRFDYDAFWREEGGTLRDDGLYALPLQPRRRAAVDIASNKRGQYQRRYDWLEGVAAAMRPQWHLA